MTVRIRSLVTPAIIVCALIGSSSTSHAFTLNRLAASIDMSRLAAGASGSGAAALANEVSLAIPVRVEVPPSVELVSASTEIRIGVPHESDVDIEVANEAGEIVCSARVHMPAGWQKLGFSGHGAHGVELPNGTYFYRVRVGDDILTTRILINR